MRPRHDDGGGTYTAVRDGADKDVLQEDVFCIECGHRPELALDEAHALHREVGRVADDEVDRSPGHVADPFR